MLVSAGTMMFTDNGFNAEIAISNPTTMADASGGLA